MAQRYTDQQTVVAALRSDGQVWQNFQASRLTKTSLKNRNKTMLRTDLTSHKVVSLNEWLEARKAKPGGFAGANEQGRDRSEQRRKNNEREEKLQDCRRIL